MTDCLFCKIVSGEINAYKLYEDEHVLAILDLYPVARGHLLIIPKQHSSILPETSAVESAHLFMVARRLDAALRDSLGADDVSLVVNDGPAAGQEVPHVHLHLIPRSRDDSLGPAFHSGKEQLSEEEAKKLQDEFSYEP